MTVQPPRKEWLNRYRLDRMGGLIRDVEISPWRTLPTLCPAFRNWRKGRC